MIIIADNATPELDRVARLVRRPRALMAATGKRVEKELRAHFLAKDKQGNAKGWPRAHFWNREVRSNTAFTGADDTSATVTVASPSFLHKLQGGTVRPKRKKFLAIPLTARAKAAGAPGEGGWRGGGLNFIRISQGRALLVEAVHTRLAFRRGKVAGGKQAGGEAQYLLLKSVTHAPDPTALPADRVFHEAIDDAARGYFERELP